MRISLPPLVRAVCALCTLGLLAVAPLHAGQRFPLEIAIGHDSNVANARQGGNERDAVFGLASAGTDSVWTIDARTALQTRALIEGQAFERYAGLTSAKVLFGGRLIARPSQAFYAPTFGLGGSIAWTEFDSRLRDAADVQLSALLSEQLTTRIGARLTVQSLWRRAQDAAFDARQRSAALDLDWMLGRRFATYFGYQYRRGDFTTVTPAVGPALARAAQAIARDDVFEGEFAARQDGDAHIGTLGFNFALSPQFGLDAMGRFIESESDLGVRYRRTQVLLSLLARF